VEEQGENESACLEIDSSSTPGGFVFALLSHDAGAA